MGEKVHAGKGNNKDEWFDGLVHDTTAIYVYI